MTDLTFERASELLIYSQESGQFTWRIDRHKHRAGTVAGVVDRTGYRRIKTGGKSYAAHRLAVLLMTGHWPVDEADHINLDRDDNRWCNIREATKSQNRANVFVRSHSSSGLKGVAHRPPRCRRIKTVYEAYIRKDGQRRHLGHFDTAEEAQHAYALAARQLHGEFARV